MRSYSRLNLVYSIFSGFLLLLLLISISAFLFLFFHCYCALGSHYTLVSLEVFIRYVQIISIIVGKAFLQLVLPLAYHIYIVLDLIPSCMTINSRQYTHFRNTYVLNMSSFTGHHSAPYNIVGLIAVL